jgi:hypothetical protein
VVANLATRDWAGATESYARNVAAKLHGGAGAPEWRGHISTQANGCYAAATTRLTVASPLQVASVPLGWHTFIQL